MCTIPPPPPPLLPPPPPPPAPLPAAPCPNGTQSPKSCDSSPTFPNVCDWTSEPQLWEACAINKLCLQKAPFAYKYKKFEPIMQIGPTCGLVALSMLLNGEVSPDELLNITKMEGFSNNGEMFSCVNMIHLAEKAISLAELDSINFCIKTGGLFSEEIILELLNGAVLLVAYDADFNNSPCLRHGHTAHWALVCGIIVVNEPKGSYISDPENVYVLCRHGKSKFLAAWTLDQLDKSNKNLWEFSPKKQEDGLLYVLPDGGIGGENGLRDQFLIFNGLSK